MCTGESVVSATLRAKGPVSRLSTSEKSTIKKEKDCVHFYCSDHITALAICGEFHKPKKNPKLPSTLCYDVLLQVRHLQTPWSFPELLPSCVEKLHKNVSGWICEVSVSGAETARKAS